MEIEGSLERAPRLISWDGATERESREVRSVSTNESAGEDQAEGRGSFVGIPFAFSASALGPLGKSGRHERKTPPTRGDGAIITLSLSAGCVPVRTVTGEKLR